MSAQGTVKFFSHLKNYGFITGQDGTEVFLHISGVAGNPPVTGDQVSYDVQMNQENGKWCAVNVQGGTGYRREQGKGFNNNKGKGKGKGGFW